MAHTIAEVLAAVQAADAGADSIVAYNVKLKARVAELLAGQMTEELSAGLDRIFDMSTADAAKLAEAVGTGEV